MKKFNLSYSLMSSYDQCQLQCYFQFLSYTKKTDPGMDVYGAAGNSVHNAI